jgi:hypothetical protein
LNWIELLLLLLLLLLLTLEPIASLCLHTWQHKNRISSTRYSYVIVLYRVYTKRRHWDYVDAFSATRTQSCGSSILWTFVEMSFSFGILKIRQYAELNRHQLCFHVSDLQLTVIERNDKINTNCESIVFGAKLVESQGVWFLLMRNRIRIPPRVLVILIYFSLLSLFSPEECLGGNLT